MVTTRGRSEVDALFREAADALLKVHRGAARRAAMVIAEDAKARLGNRKAETANGSEVLIADTVKVRTQANGGRIIAWVETRGPGAYVTRWLEWGTAPHIISVDIRVTGKTPERINAEAKQGSLVIGRNFVGATVPHYGARPYPFLRPAFDTMEDEAIAEAQRYIAERVRRNGIFPTEEDDG